MLALWAAPSAEGVGAVMFSPPRGARREGTFSFRKRLEDIGAVLERLRRPDVPRTFGVGPSRAVLAGYSWGGGMSLAYTREIPPYAIVPRGTFATGY